MKLKNLLELKSTILNDEMAKEHLDETSLIEIKIDIFCGLNHCQPRIYMSIIRIQRLFFSSLKPGTQN
jgi:hypothetical protein